MIIIKNTQELEDANEFGEILRDYVFLPDMGGDLGAYSTFKTREEFKKMECPPDIAVILMGGVDPEWHPEKIWEEDRKKLCNYLTNGEIEVAWYWDGDGALFLREGERAAFNCDCKKRYGWNWIKSPSKSLRERRGE